MSDSVKTARGIVANAAALAVSFLVTFLLTPLVVSGFGSVRYGVWVIVGTLASYLALLDLGLRTAVTTYVARDHAVGDHQGASAKVSAALWTRRWVGLCAFGGALVMAAVIERIQTIPRELVWEARQALVVYAFAFIVSLFGGVFAGVLQAINRQDVVATTTMVQTGVKAVGTVLLILNGYSLVALAALEALATSIANVLFVYRSLRLYPELRPSFTLPARGVLVELGRYSGELVLWQLFGRIIATGPSLIIGALLSPASVTFFALGSYLVSAVEQVRMAVTPTFMPLASRYDASGNVSGLQGLLTRGTRLVLAVVLPILVGLVVRGETFLGVWMGPEYSEPAGGVLKVLAVWMMMTSAMAPGVVIILGLGRQRQALIWSGVQAAITLLLSVPLARSFGIVGVAWAVTGPAVLGIGMTRIACRLAHVSLMTYVLGSWSRPALASVPFAIACAAADRYWDVTSIEGFLLQIVVTFPIHVLSCMAFLADDLKQGWLLLRPRPARVVQESVP